ncbi:MAG: hypothetical protein LBL74_08380 [Bacteroidales bacterium]|nr:hypothetical protein [Bacteroidales bacterium]
MMLICSKKRFRFHKNRRIRYSDFLKGCLVVMKRCFIFIKQPFVKMKQRFRKT